MYASAHADGRYAPGWSTQRDAIGWLRQCYRRCLHGSGWRGSARWQRRRPRRQRLVVAAVIKQYPTRLPRHRRPQQHTGPPAAPPSRRRAEPAPFSRRGFASRAARGPRPSSLGGSFPLAGAALSPARVRRRAAHQPPKRHGRRRAAGEGGGARDARRARVALRGRALLLQRELADAGGVDEQALRRRGGAVPLQELPALRAVRRGGGRRARHARAAAAGGRGRRGRRRAALRALGHRRRRLLREPLARPRVAAPPQLPGARDLQELQGDPRRHRRAAPDDEAPRRGQALRRLRHVRRRRALPPFYARGSRARGAGAVAPGRRPRRRRAPRRRHARPPAPRFFFFSRATIGIRASPGTRATRPRSCRGARRSGRSCCT